MNDDKKYMTMIPASAISGFNYRGIISEDKDRFTLKERKDIHLSVGDVFLSLSESSYYIGCVTDLNKTDTEEGWTELYRGTIEEFTADPEV